MNNFIIAKPGTLWRFVHQADDMLLYRCIWFLNKGGNPNYFSDYDHRVIDIKLSVLKLKEARQPFLSLTNLQMQSIYQILATVTTGEQKIGWVTHDFIKRLKPYG